MFESTCFLPQIQSMCSQLVRERQCACTKPLCRCCGKRSRGVQEHLDSPNQIVSPLVSTARRPQGFQFSRALITVGELTVHLSVWSEMQKATKLPGPWALHPGGSEDGTKSGQARPLTEYKNILKSAQTTQTVSRRVILRSVL